ncbi:MAG: ROK family protein, partial [Candidatus Hydrogenedentales bacterium]
MPEHILGIDIGGTNIVAAVFDLDFNIIGRAKKKSRSKKKDEERTEDRVVRAAEEALAEANVESVRGIGIGSPGPLDPTSGTIIETPNLEWKQFPLAQFMSDAFGVPAVLDNDVNLGTYGEYHFGDVRDCRYVLGVFPGTGIGGGFIVDGQLYYGYSGAAIEIGHMTVVRNGPYCGCGKRGCLEAVASRIAIAAEVAALAARHDAPYILENFGTDIANIRSGAIASAIEAGEQRVESVVREAAYYTGLAVGNLVNVLSPDAVVLGGGLVEAMPALYMEEVRKGMVEHAM